MRSFLLMSILFSGLSALAQDPYLFIGTYTDKGSKGIYVYRFDRATGKAEWVSNTDSARNPSYLAIAPGASRLYAVNETGGPNGGGVSAYAFDRASGKLQLLNQQSSGGDHPCYAALSANGKWLAVGNYSGGNISVFPLQPDGSLEPVAQLVQHSGSSVNRQRQEKAHVHAAVFSPEGTYLMAPDLGTDEVAIYAFNGTTDKPLKKTGIAASEKGSGPRHLTFHPNGKFAYLMEELSGTVAVYSYRNGKLEPVQRLSSHPTDFTGTRGSADIHVSPDGRFLYASNRGDANSLAIFSIDPASGKLESAGYQSTLGLTPRNFVIDPSGQFLLVANQQSSNVVIFRRDLKTGLLTDTGHTIVVPNPVCLKFAE